MRNILHILFVFHSLLSFAQSNSELIIDAFGKYESDQYDEAIHAFQALIDENQTAKPEWFLYKGISEFNQELYQKAGEDFNRALHGNVSEASLWNARLFIVSGKPGEAIHSLEDYLRKSEFPDINLIKKDSLLIQLHSSDAWFALWQNEWRSEEQMINEEAEFFVRKGDYRKAHEAVEVRLGSGLNEAILYESNSRVYRAEGNLHLALNELNKALQLSPDKPDLQRIKAELLMELKLYDDAETILSGILSRFPGDFEVRFMRAQTYMMIGNNANARNDINIYLKYFNTNEAHYLAGQMSYKTGNTFDALSHINPLLEKDKSNASYFKLRGMIYYECRTFKQSAYDLSMSLDLAPNDAETNYFLGLSEFELKNEKLGCYYTKRAMKLGDSRASAFLLEHPCK
jgi:tetratricopeptide (TPR) repeat protein